ncbi:hypothetical protein GF373_05230 [bacterium]|nr:hypothetical protein [bacterium]
MKNYSLFMIFVFAGQLGMADIPNIQMPPAKQIPELVRNGKQLEKLTGDSTWPRRYGVHFKMEASEHQEIGNAILGLHREGVLKTKKSQKNSLRLLIPLIAKSTHPRIK